MSSKSVVNISNQSELIDTIKSYVEEELVFKSDTMDKLIAKAESMYKPNMTDADKLGLQSIIDDAIKIQNDYDSMLMLEVKKSKGEVDNYGIPVSFGMDKVPYDDSFKEGVLGFVKSIVKEETKDLSEDEFIKINQAIIKKVLPLMFEVIRQHFGDSFQRSINRIKELMSDSELPTTIYHFETLEQCAVHYSNLAHYGHYSSKRDAWRDAVKREVTYSKNKVKISKFQDLERALERVRDAHKQDEYGLIK